MIALQAIEIFVFLGLTCAWNQPNTCYERKTYTKDLQISALQENIKQIEEKLSILQTYLEETLENTTSSGEDESTLKDCDYLQTIDEKLDVQIAQFGHYNINITQEIVDQVKTVLEGYKIIQSDEQLENETDHKTNTSQLLGTFLNPAPSCMYVPENSSSGNYWIQNAGTGNASLEYCDMSKRCCNSTGEWMRVGHLDMTDPTHHCPTGFREVTSPNRTCGSHGSGCYSTSYPVNGISYSRVRGRIKAYQYFSPDAFDPYYTNRALTIDDLYVDGVSLTHGRNPRKHIWTFAAAVDEVHSNDRYVCPCTKTHSSYIGVVPPFIGNDYFCETGSRYTRTNQFYSEDPLWDGAGCGDSSTCCQFNNPPWFCKQLPQPTTDDIELRLCADEALSNEDIALEQVEFFVQ